MDVYHSFVNLNNINESKSILYNLILAGYLNKRKCFDLYRVRPLFYLKKIDNNGDIEWESTFYNPNLEEYKNGIAKQKITEEYQALKTKSNHDSSVIIELENQDLAIIFKDKYSTIPMIINNYHTLKNQISNNSQMKDGTKNIIAALILTIALLGSSIIIAYSNRYQLIDSGFGVVDTWTKKIEKVHQ